MIMKRKLFLAVILVLLFCVDLIHINAETVSGFVEQTQINTTSYVTDSVYAADLDNDGDLDILSASNSDTIAWYKNNRDGTFTEQPAISTTANGAYSVYAADLDNDGDMDVLSASYLDDTIAWYKNNGDDTFTEQPPISTTEDEAVFVYAADLDNDGDMDVLSACYVGDTISWFMNNGDGTFIEQSPISTTSDGARNVYAVDINNDGFNDVLSSSSIDDTISWYKNNGDNTFTEQTAISTTADEVDSIFFADLDNDGNVDVLSAVSNDNTIMWYKNNGDGTFTEQPAISTTALGVKTIHTADLDNDGDIDVLSGNDDGTISWYENNRNGTFSEPNVISENVDGARTIIAADLDNDGDLDIVAGGASYDKIDWFKNTLSHTSPTVTFEVNGGSVVDDYTFTTLSGFEEQPALSTTSDGAHSVYAVDLDNDGDKDVLSASSGDNTISWFMNNGDGTFIEQSAISTTADGAASVYAEDLDNDGDMDVISANSNEATISWYRNNNDGTFTEQPPISTIAFGVLDVYADDLDNDGDIDVISACFSNSTIAWYENNGDGTFAAEKVITSSSNESGSVYAVDLDNDGDIDVLQPGILSQKMAWYENNGDKTFTEQATISIIITYGSISIYAADLDNDGYNDIILTSMSASTITWYKNNGDGTFTEQTAVSTMAVGVYGVYAEDLDNDGDIDILSANYTIDGILWYMNNGDGTFTEQTAISTNADGAIAVYAADLDNDGDKDVLSASANDNTITWYKNIGNSFILNCPLSPTKDGYVFEGWYTDSLLTNPYDFSTVVQNDFTLYAAYSSNQHKVEFIDYDGTVLQSVNYEINADLTGIMAPLEPSREGYSFDSWIGSIPATMGTSDITVTATYTINQYKVEFVDFDGAVLQTAYFDYHADISGVTSPIDPSRVGYTFYNWVGTVPATMGTSDITIIAGYDINQYLVSFDIDGTITTEMVDYLGMLQSVPISTLMKSGYTFVEWQVDNVAVDPDLYVQGLSDTVFTAIFIDITNPIIVGVQNNQVFVKNTEVTITYNEGTATLNNKGFASGTVISGKGDYNLVVTDAAGNITTVHFEIEGGMDPIIFIGVGVVVFIILVFIIRKLVPGRK